MKDPDRNAWRDPDLVAEMRSESAQMVPPDGARARVLHGLMAGVAVGALAKAGMASTQAVSTGAGVATHAAGTGATGVAAAGAGAAGATGAGTAGVTASVVATGTVATGSGLLAKGVLALAILGGGTAVTVQAISPTAPTTSANERVRPVHPPTPNHGTSAQITPTRGQPAPHRTAPHRTAPHPTTLQQPAPHPIAMATTRAAIESSPAPAPDSRPVQAAAHGVSGVKTVAAPPKARTPRRPKARPSAPRTDLALRTETRLIARARKSLSAGKLDAAAAALRSHARRFARGRHLEERLALTIVVLHRQGETAAAQTRFARFRAQYPQSLYERGVRLALAQ